MDHGRRPARHGGDGGAAGRGVLEGAFSLLEALARVEEGGLSELAATAGLPKTTVHRMLDQLVALDAVERRSGRYRMGPAIVRLGRAWSPERPLHTAATGPLRHLAAATRASVSVSVPGTGSPLVVAALPGEVDDVFPLRAGAVLPPGSAAEVVLAAAGPATAPPEGQCAPQWQRRIEVAREQGTALDHYEADVLVACLAAPVRAPSGKVVAALAVSVLDRRRLADAGEPLRRAARMIGANLARMPQAWQL
ncbi:helix-turn-helix domain-containing protein [Streptomyces sp. BPTC-684]|uniref:IclR family transcriptional regulator n=1 Tax=Streptomyces sp. BPTC-684 TaxID=3043734 RepID=UPI0024B16F32|nr:helix-turn-helix domain-containing protein [Streptomyces sp. BPTC-684]WHM40394.1 helix-turn-helix domain-containing protein [Streptomyces sp. BPTC-684]